MTVRRTPIALFVCLFVFPLFAQSVNVSATDIQNTLTGIVTSEQSPGAMLIVDPIGSPPPSTFVAGYANLANNAPLQSNMTFRIGSNTKTFTATVVLQLIDENTKIPGTSQVVNLDTTAVAILGTSAMASVPNASLITIRQLLSMTSGVYDYNDDDFVATVYKSPATAWTPQQILATIAGKPAYFAPGAACGQCPQYCASNQTTSNCFMYSNTNYIILGMIIEKLTGDTAPNQIQKRILTPLKLTNTSFPTTSAITGYVNGYQATGASQSCTGPVGAAKLYDDVTTCFNPTSAWTAGAMISNLTDMQTWLTALVGGKMISATMQSERTTWVLGMLEGIPIQYGLGLMRVGIGPANQAPYFQGHAGEFWGYGTVMMQGESPCGVQILDVVNAMAGTPYADPPPTYAEIFFATGASVCTALTPTAASRSVTNAFSKVQGPLFWTD
jgi:CubicO group peptidase (beta-lactamase class C family)